MTIATSINPRVDVIFTDVLHALTDIIERHHVTHEEFGAATAWLASAGSQGFEIPLMLDVFLSTRVDNVNAAHEGTETNVEGPFYIADSPRLEQPYILPKRPDEPGQRLVFSGTVARADGSPLSGAMLDIWQANGNGEYSHFHPNVPESNLRGRLTTDADGRYSFETVVPSPYEIPKTGATGQLLDALGRSAFRPGHVHFKLTHEDVRQLTTQVYFEGDPYIDNDVVGAVKAPLITRLNHNTADDGTTYASATFDFELPA
jgi:catechol 1,2-dioxygenase